MADNTVADMPKKNAVPAEAPKSLAATVQQVLTKAVTHPSDPKSDFAQGVSHITGDPHQKSAGTADTAKSLKAEDTDKEDKEKETLKANADKEKEAVKEAEEKKEDEKKDVKEGELPAALQKAIDKKKEDAKESTEDKKEDEKKDVKESETAKDKKEDMKHGYDKDGKSLAPKTESDDKKEDEKKEVSESEDKEDLKAEKEKEMLKAEIDQIKKELNDKEKMMASYDKEMKEEDEKEKEAKKEMTAKDKVKDMDMKEDVAALTEGEELTSEFKQKAATVFEAAVKAKLVEEIENLEGEYETKVNEKVSEVKEEIVDKVDAYLNYVVEEWMKENELAIEKGLRNEITEDFIGGLKSLFESHYINVPQEKYDVIESQAAEIEKLKEDINKSIEKNVELNQKIAESTREDIIKDVSSDLAATEADKLKGLAEGIEYKDADSFRKSVETLKNSYYPKAKASDTESNEVAGNAGTDNLSESMAAYSAAISKSKKNPYLK